MKWLPIAASFIVACAPAVTSAAAHKHHPHSHNAHPAKAHHAKHHPHHASVIERSPSARPAALAGTRTRSASLLNVRYPERTDSSAGATTTSPTHHRRKRKAHVRGVQLPKGPTPDRISQIQSALARGGYYQGDPTGKWDDNTVAAMQKFQSAHGIDPSGKIDATSLQKLGLGSDVAGVSAPRPVSSSSTASNTLASQSALAGSANGSGIAAKPPTPAPAATTATDSTPTNVQAAAPTVAPAPATASSSGSGSR